MQTLEAVYENGKLTFKEPPPKKYSRVLVTFLEEETKIPRDYSFPKIDIKKLMKRRSVLDGLDGILEGVDITPEKKKKLNDV